MNTVQKIALVLVIIGAINWGLIGFFQLNVVAAIFGGITTLPERIVYAIIGLSGLYCITLFARTADERERERGMQPTS
ncbi:MAG: DUF378 domain-containing protein [Desulfitobacteriia bacterium]